MIESELPLDFLGQEIVEGCTIVYPVRSGAQMWLQKMRVSQVVKTGDTYRLKVYDPDSTMKRSLTIKNLHTCVVVRPH